MQDSHSDQAWDQAQAKLQAHFLQSSAWAAFQNSLHRKTFREGNDSWSWQAFERQSRGIKYLLAPYGPTIREQNHKPALQTLLKKAREIGADFIRIEPVGQLSEEQLRAMGGLKISEVEPSHTLVLDLTQADETLRSGLASGHRNRINTAAKRQIVVTKSTDQALVNDFLKLLNQTYKRAHIKNYPDSYYRKMVAELMPSGVAKFYITYAADKLASISLIFDWEGVRYYAHTGNDQLVNRQSSAAVVGAWQMISDARKAGMQKFDFWGIAPTDDPKHKWAGMTAFKKGFGGEVVATVGTWDIPVHKLKYRAYGLYRKLRGRG